MTREIGIGLLGVGWMGRLHSSSYLRVPAHYPDCDGVARLVVAADEVESRARGAVEQLGYERWTTDWRDVVADPEVDALSIVAPNFLHRDMALASAAAGKPFWAEKPLGRFPHETAEIAAAAEDAGVVTIVGLNYRHAPAVQHARALVASGTLADLGSHAIDLAQFLLGPIVRVTATTALLIPRRPLATMGEGTHFSVVEDGAELGDVENEDWAAALVEFERGVKGTIELSRVLVGAEARYAFEVNGTEGAVGWDFE